MREHRYNEYTFGQRGRLTVGSKFRAKGGPYFVTEDGRKIALGDGGGILTFVAYVRRGRASWIEATCGAETRVLVLTGRPCLEGMKRGKYRLSLARVTPETKQLERKRSKRAAKKQKSAAAAE